MDKILLITALAILASPNIQKENDLPKNSYLIRMAYINRIQNCYGDNIAASWGVPGYASPHIYSYIALAFWTCERNLKVMTMVYENTYSYFEYGNFFGTPTDEVQKSLRRIYKNAINIHKAIGHLVNFYNVNLFNQEESE
jgi:hypothetical protein